MRSEECEWCYLPAIAVLHAQWTVADWQDYLACAGHLGAAWSLANRTTIDGATVLELHWHYFE